MRRRLSSSRCCNLEAQHSVKIGPVSWLLSWGAPCLPASLCLLQKIKAFSLALTLTNIFIFFLIGSHYNHATGRSDKHPTAGGLLDRVMNCRCCPGEGLCFGAGRGVPGARSEAAPAPARSRRGGRLCLLLTTSFYPAMS